MKIINRGEKPTVTFEVKCGSCNTLFEYVLFDVQIDNRDGNYVTCPVCGQFIAHGNGIHYGER